MTQLQGREFKADVVSDLAYFSEGFLSLVPSYVQLSEGFLSLVPSFVSLQVKTAKNRNVMMKCKFSHVFPRNSSYPRIPNSSTSCATPGLLRLIRRRTPLSSGRSTKGQIQALDSAARRRRFSAGNLNGLNRL